jgi:hypothetical protein
VKSSAWLFETRHNTSARELIWTLELAALPVIAFLNIYEAIFRGGPNEDGEKRQTDCEVERQAHEH